MYESQKTLLFKKKGRRRGNISLAMIEYYTLQMCQKQGKAATRIDKSNYIFCAALLNCEIENCEKQQK
jgi:hypothetical protein